MNFFKAHLLKELQRDRQMRGREGEIEISLNWLNPQMLRGQHWFKPKPGTGASSRSVTGVAKGLAGHGQGAGLEVEKLGHLLALICLCVSAIAGGSSTHSLMMPC